MVEPKPDMATVFGPTMLNANSEREEGRLAADYEYAGSDGPPLLPPLLFVALHCMSTS